MYIHMCIQHSGGGPHYRDMMDVCMAWDSRGGPHYRDMMDVCMTWDSRGGPHYRDMMDVCMAWDSRGGPHYRDMMDVCMAWDSRGGPHYRDMMDMCCFTHTAEIATAKVLFNILLLNQRWQSHLHFPDSNIQRYVCLHSSSSVE